MAEKSPLEKFYDSLGEAEKAILKDYVNKRDYEVLASRFDKLVGEENED